MTLAIQGMSCGHCLNSVSQALNGLAGVRVKSVRMGRAELEYDEAAIRPEQVIAAIREVGYPAAPLA